MYVTISIFIPSLVHHQSSIIINHQSSIIIILLALTTWIRKYEVDFQADQFSLENTIDNSHTYNDKMNERMENNIPNE